MKTAVIGLGNIGSIVAGLLAKGGQRIIVADRTFAKAGRFARELGKNAEAMEVPDAIKAADTVVMAVWFDTIKELLSTYRSELSGKIIIDPSNPLAHDGNGGFKKTIPVDLSAGQTIAGLVPSGAEVVKAFGTLKAESLGKYANRMPDRAVLFYATDFPEAAGTVESLITASGYVPKSIGGINQSIHIEAFGDLHEVGKLGRLVSAKEADAQLSARSWSAHGYMQSANSMAVGAK
jgi:hypothetical protein